VLGCKIIGFPFFFLVDGWTINHGYDLIVCFGDKTKTPGQ
jgi:hypothetical protein